MKFLLRGNDPATVKIVDNQVIVEELPANPDLFATMIAAVFAGRRDFQILYSLKIIHQTSMLVNGEKS